MNNHKKHKKAHKRNKMRRNAVPTAIARIVRPAVSRRRPTAAEIAEADLAAADAAAARRSAAEDSTGVRLLKAIGGGLGTTIVGSLLEHQTTVPAPWVNLGIGGLGAALAYGSPNKTWRSLGLGAAAAATTLLGRALIDYELFSPDEPKKVDKPAGVSSGHPGTPAPGKKASNASDIPADALMRAYERARKRMALASDAPN